MVDAVFTRLTSVYLFLLYQQKDRQQSVDNCFFIRHELLEDDLDTCLRAVIRAALSGYETIRRCCTGDFEAAEAETIRKKASALVRALSGGHAGC